MLPEIIEVVLAANATTEWARTDWRACRSVNRAFQDAADRRILNSLRVNSSQLIGLTGNVRPMLDNEPSRHGLVSRLTLVGSVLDHLASTVLAACHNVRSVFVRQDIFSQLHTHMKVPLLHLPRLQQVAFTSRLPFGEDDSLSTFWKFAASITSVDYIHLAFVTPAKHGIPLNMHGAETLNVADDNPNLRTLGVVLHGPYLGNGSDFDPILSRCSNLQYFVLHTTGEEYIPDIATAIPGTVRGLQAHCSFASVHKILRYISDDRIMQGLAFCPVLSVAERDSKIEDLVAGSEMKRYYNPTVSIRELDKAIDCLKMRKLLSESHEALDGLRQRLSVYYELEEDQPDATASESAKDLASSQ